VPSKTFDEPAGREGVATPPDEIVDVVVVGGGLAGVTAATVLARQGVRVALVDRWASFPPLFRAERIQPDQANLFRKLGVMDALLPRTGHVREIVTVWNGRPAARPTRIEQFGIFYSVTVRVARVRDLATTSDLQTVTLDGGLTIRARLVALASGMGGELRARLGLRDDVVQKEQSVSFGFTLGRRDGAPFDFDALVVR
jgi:2-polyprenyl-6-methoxyphenol hydroxylase-like FAD-dependent oxidoreductase